MNYRLLRSLVKSDLSGRQIAVKLRVSLGTTQYWLRKFGLKTHKRRKYDGLRCRCCKRTIDLGTIHGVGRKYCSLDCQMEFQYISYIRAWKEGKRSGMNGGKCHALSKHVRRYIFKKYKNRCAKCRWGKLNTYTGLTPLEIDHIDGDHKNSSEGNLVLLCPNCHSLTPTYKGRNRGSGRAFRNAALTQLVE